MNVIYGVRTPTDVGLVRSASDWLSGSLGCLFGRREWFRQRYMIALIGDSAEFVEANALFKARVAEETHSACLYVTRRDPASFADGREALAWLREDLLAGIDLVSGMGDTTLSQTIRVKCPVTGRVTDFPDFDIVAFYPQAANEGDPLYDPSIEAPLVCLNQASDLYGFALYMREVAERSGGKDSLAALPACAMKAMAQWNDMARKTIDTFRKRTNPAVLCPASVSADGHHYISPHNEAAFHELEKKVHLSEMPKTYLVRLLGKWELELSGHSEAKLNDVVKPAVCLSDSA